MYLYGCVVLSVDNMIGADKETISWLVMQDVHDPRAFSIVSFFQRSKEGPATNTSIGRAV